MAFFGELYLRSTRPFLAPHVTEAEGRYLKAHLPEGLGLDVGCGHGRHLEQLRGLPLVGVDFDPLSLSEARVEAPVVRADFFRLPFRDHAFASAFTWYNTFSTFEDARVPGLLRELARCVRPGGTFILQGSNLHKVKLEPTAHFDGELPDGCHLVEDCRFDADRHRDEVTRRLTLPDGNVLTASFFIRYYELDELSHLLHEAGLEVRWVHGGVDGGELLDASPDLIVGAQKRD